LSTTATETYNPSARVGSGTRWWHPSQRELVTEPSHKLDPFSGSDQLGTLAAKDPEVLLNLEATGGLGPPAFS